MINADNTSNICFIKSRSNVTLVFGIFSIITSFVSLGFFLGIIGLIYGFIDLLTIKQKQSGKKKIAAGIICCLLGIIFTVISSISYVNMFKMEPF
ncbi:hypothetical protein MKZ17_09485 [Solibacillus sp. FSL R7-0682]|uniref:hypothetical protein n=1 Tax=Solibacillus sp. FSL R7-0682 TaxID=2921690 RepID=UPI0030F9ADE8